ncbi:hypothetical protein BN14_05161 [Rhizoctonia solani AG-1 IB]|uniref:Uncharacterized protein n=1 Tax=Thanatephorus cucumeris (strain AG1-IB / isolate 7/3/14) TaxID=1108050 RepID=M5C5I4_THACB|nr:hypothetical protein BN14_05161 [Rhizoctonia solani AG-1 IB]
MVQRFYQIVGYQGHFRPYYWKPHRDFGGNHEFAQEPHAVEAIAGPKSALWVKSDPNGNDIKPFFELIMGIRPHGAISLLMPEAHFDAHVKPAMGWTHRAYSCPDPYPTGLYASLSPIRFESDKELANMLKELRPAKAGTKGCDDSKLNRYLKEGVPKPERGMFEQARLLWQILYAGRTDLPNVYGIPPLPTSLRIIFFSFTLWIDPNTYEPSPNEDLEVLDFGWHEPTTDTTKHYIIEDYSSFSKTSIGKSEFAHGDSITIPESDIPSALDSLFSGTDPIVLVTHDWTRTCRFLSSHGIDTNAPSWSLGVGKLLGFERPGEPVPGGPAADGQVSDRRRSSSVRSFNGDSSARRHGSNDRYTVDSKVLDEFEHGREGEGKSLRGHGSRWDPSFPTRDRRSLSPRSRARPLNRPEDRHHKPIFRPDEDEQDGKIPNAALRPDVHVLDLRELFISLVATRRPFVLYPPMANRLGFQVPGWCAGNWARQFFEIFASLVGQSPIHRRIEDLKKTPGVAPLQRENKVPTLLEGIAGQKKEEVKAAWGDSSDEEDD